MNIYKEETFSLLFLLPSLFSSNLQHKHANPAIEIEQMANAIIDYKNILRSWCLRHNLHINVESVLSKYVSKEFKVCLFLAKKHELPNPLNTVFQTRLKSIDASNYRDLTELMLSVYYPVDIGEVGPLLRSYDGNERELILKLQTNYNACEVTLPSEIDYHQILTEFLNDVDPERVTEVAQILAKVCFNNCDL